ncbi:MAG: 3-oxoacyl-ACP reductase FabG [Bacteroidota bacterium]
MRLENKVAIVTGAARGIGKAVAELFCKEGATVEMWDLLEDGEEVAAAIRESGGKATFTKISVTDKAAVEGAMSDAFKRHGKIDILINNAGITRDKTLAKMSDEEWHQVIDVNLNGVFYATRAVIPYMREHNYGRIVTAASTVGIRGNYGQTNYVATKSGIIGMTKTWALELGRYGITANCIAPGYTLTEMTKLIPSHIQEQAVKMIPVGKIADPIDIAYGYLYLASDEASFVTGICLPIDGGTSR